jgi:hypothetical protein
VMLKAHFVGAKAEFRGAYGLAFDAHLADPSEETLRAAYELGRDAVERQLSMIEIADIHHDVLAAALSVGDAHGASEVASRAGEFLIESLSAFEMVQRGYPEVCEQALSGERRALLLTRLSNLLADRSLTTESLDALTEALQLVAEHALELTGARTCTVRVRRYGSFPTSPILASAFSHAESATEVDAAGDLHQVALTTLAGLEVGSLELVTSCGQTISAKDMNVIAHVAEMASAAVERAQLYANQLGPPPVEGHLVRGRPRRPA